MGTPVFTSKPLKTSANDFLRRNSWNASPNHDFDKKTTDHETSLKNKAHTKTQWIPFKNACKGKERGESNF